MYTPGMQPTSSDAVMPSWKSPNSTCPSAAAPTSGTACTRSVPTSWLARSTGYSISSAMMMSEPEPTLVMPTTRPPTAPMMTVGHDPDVHRRRRRGGVLGDPGGAALHPLAQRHVRLDDEAGAARSSA